MPAEGDWTSGIVTATTPIGYKTENRRLIGHAL